MNVWVIAVWFSTLFWSNPGVYSNTSVGSFEKPANPIEETDSQLNCRGLSDAIIKEFSFSYESTKWCGPGNTAENEDDLGELKEVDMCCREHDFCPDSIRGLDSENGVTNYQCFTMSACECDEKFSKCLEKIDSYDSNVVGGIFFKLLNVTCFDRSTGNVQYRTTEFSGDSNIINAVLRIGSAVYDKFFEE